MKKTLTANISGTVFHIEEDAYEALQRYLTGIRSRFDGSPGRDEIMADIEARIAELLTERLEGKRQVVNTTDVDHVIGVMGRPEDYTGGADESDRPPGTEAGQAQGPVRRRLYRDPDDKWIGGVLGGVAAYFGIDPLVLRILYLVFLFMGFGFILYLILWIVVPQASTAAEKLEMRGEPVNVDNIKRVVEDGAERLSKGARTVAREAEELGRRYAPQAGKGAEGVLSFLGEAMRLFLIAAGKFIGVMLLVAGAVAAIVLMAVVLGRYDMVCSGTGGEAGLHQWSLLVFGTQGELDRTWLALVAFLLVPVISLLYGGVNLLFGVKAPQWVGWSLMVVWIASIVLLSWSSVRLVRDMRRSDRIVERTVLATPAGGTLHLTDLPDGERHPLRPSHDPSLMRTADGEVHLGWGRMDVRRSPDSLYHLVVERTARGRSLQQAAARAAAIQVDHETVGDTLRLAPWYTFPEGDLFRGQRVRFVVEVPVGGRVHFEPGARRLMHGIRNTSNTRDRHMVGRTWTMTAKGLSGGPVKPEEEPVERIEETRIEASRHGIVIRRHQQGATAVWAPSSSAALGVGMLPRLLNLLSLPVR